MQTIIAKGPHAVCVAMMGDNQEAVVYKEMNNSLITDRGGADMDNFKEQLYDRMGKGQGSDIVSHGLERPADNNYIARRLTPTECARLQGFPDDWVADVPHSDSAEYKLWGNGIALPCLLPMMKSMKEKLQEVQ